jgi:hypothetical protein
LKLGPIFKVLQNSKPSQNRSATGPVPTDCLDSQALATFGATSVDHGTAATGFHANQKAVGTGATDLGGLVSAFHFWKSSEGSWAICPAMANSPGVKSMFSFLLNSSGEPWIIANFDNNAKYHLLWPHHNLVGR